MTSTGSADNRGGHKVVAALVAGLVVFVFLFQWGGGTSADPPTCFGMLGYPVPCGGWPAVAAGVLTAAMVWLAFWLWDLRR